MRLQAGAAVFLAMLLGGCAAPKVPLPAPSSASPYLLVFAGDEDGASSDFLAVIDLRPGVDSGKAIATTPIGLTKAMPHHMEYALPPAGELLFMNAHHHEKSLMVDVGDPRAPRIVKTFAPPPPFRYPHDYYRTPTGTRLVGFLRSEGASPDTAEKIMPGNHGGIAEYAADGRLLRTASAAVPGMTKPVRPYAFALLPDLDRLVVTSAPMMEDSSADVVQIYRYSDFTLLNTIDLQPGVVDGRPLPGSERAGFGPRVLPDGSVFLNAYGCAFYRLSDIAAGRPRLETVFALETPDVEAGDIRGSCGIPILYDHLWVMPVGQLHAVVVLDIANPSKPVEVSRFPLPSTFNPHWLARDPQSNRLVLGAELGGEDGFYLLRLDSKTGQLSFDSSLSTGGVPGYVSLKNQSWAHGASGSAWAHAALFLPE
jgi:hypothetical protein